MSDPQSLFTALYVEFTGNSDLVAALTGGMYPEIADDGFIGKDSTGLRKPYTTFHLIDNTPEYMFTASMENYLIQFSIWSEQSAPTEILNIVDKLTTVYDFATLTFGDSDFTTIKMQRQGGGLMWGRNTFEKDAWVYVIDYEVILTVV